MSNVYRNYSDCFNVVAKQQQASNVRNLVNTGDGLFKGDVQINEDLNVSGDLNVEGDTTLNNVTVNGVTSYINTTNLVVYDNTITLNSNEDDILMDSGIEIYRGVNDKANLIWSESEQQWMHGLGSSMYLIPKAFTGVNTQIPYYTTSGGNLVLTTSGNLTFNSGSNQLNVSKILTSYINNVTIPTTNIVGVSDVQTLYNKSISGQQIDSGYIVGARMPAFSGAITTSLGSTVTSLSNNVVTTAKMQTIATQSFLGRNTSGTGNVEVLSKTTARAILDINTLTDVVCDSIKVNTLTINSIPYIGSAGLITQDNANFYYSGGSVYIPKLMPSNIYSSLGDSSNYFDTIWGNSIYVGNGDIGVNAAQTGTPTLNGRVQFYRGSSQPANIQWDESTDLFKMGIGSTLYPCVLSDVVLTSGRVPYVDSLGHLTSDSSFTYVSGKLSANELQIDNININGNTISSTSGDIFITPSSKVNITKDLYIGKGTNGYGADGLICKLNGERPWSIWSLGVGAFGKIGLLPDVDGKQFSITSSDRSTEYLRASPNINTAAGFIYLRNLSIGNAAAPPCPHLVYQSDTATTAAAGITIQQAGTGDAVLQYLIGTSTTRWMTGVDNSDSDAYKITAGTDLGTNPIMSMSTSGITTFSNTTNASSVGTGSAVFTGGVSIAKDLYIDNYRLVNTTTTLDATITDRTNRGATGFYSMQMMKKVRQWYAGETDIQYFYALLAGDGGGAPDPDIYVGYDNSNNTFYSVNGNFNGQVTGNSLQIDDINIDANVISTTTTNTNLVLTPNGTGLVSTAKIFNSSNVVDSTNYSTGSIITAGGIGCAKNITAGSIQIDDININSNIISTTTTNTNLVLTPNGTGYTSIGKSSMASGNIIMEFNFDRSWYVYQNGEGEVGGLAHLAFRPSITGDKYFQIYDSAGTKEYFRVNANTTGGSVSVFNQFNADNLRLSGNTLSSSNTNGDIVLSPNGSGLVSTAKIFSSTNTTESSSVSTGSIITSGGIGCAKRVTAGELQIDNININSNTISSTNTNGDINLTPNGTGKTVISNILPINSITSVNNSDYTVLSTDTVIQVTNTTGKILTMTLPVASTCTGKRFLIKDMSGVCSRLPLAIFNNNLIDGSYTQYLTQSFGIVEVISNGSTWALLSNNCITNFQIPEISLGSLISEASTSSTNYGTLSRVSLDGSVMVVLDTTYSTGSIFIYNLNTTSSFSSFSPLNPVNPVSNTDSPYVLVQTITPSGVTGTLSRCLALSGDGKVIAIGSTATKGMLIYELSSGSYVLRNGGFLIPSDRINSTNPVIGGNAALSHDGSIFAFSVPNDNTSTLLGAVWIYRKSGSTWSNSQKISYSSEDLVNSMDVALSADGNKLFVGVVTVNSPGSDVTTINVYTYSSSFSLAQTITPTSSTNYYAGRSISVYGNYLVFTGYSKEATPLYTGLWIYEFTGGSYAVMNGGRIYPAITSESNTFGYSCSIVNGIVAVSDLNAYNSKGLVYLYQLDTSINTWVIKKIIHSNNSALYSDVNSFGTSVSLAINKLIVSSRELLPSKKGSVRVYRPLLSANEIEMTNLDAFTTVEQSTTSTGAVLAQFGKFVNAAQSMFIYTSSNEFRCLAAGYYRVNFVATLKEYSNSQPKSQVEIGCNVDSVALLNTYSQLADVSSGVRDFVSLSISGVVYIGLNSVLSFYWRPVSSANLLLGTYSNCSIVRVR